MRTGPAVLLGLLAACQPNSTRPSFTPVPEAAATEIRLSPRDATERLAAALEADSLPPARVHLGDAFLETAWLDSASGRPTRERPVGTDVVKIRAWADPGRPGYALLIVETLYRPLADPSLPLRELERQVPRDHPTAKKVERILEAMVARYGGPPRTPPPAARQPTPAFGEDPGTLEDGEEEAGPEGEE